MEEYKIKANEQFFINTINTLREGGMWVWKDFGFIFYKENNKLVGDVRGVIEVKGIVSEEFFKKHFVVR